MGARRRQRRVRRGQGTDALVFGVTDRDANDVPTLSDLVPGSPFGIPTADVTGQNGFCRIDPGPPGSGYDFLIRFFVRSTGNLAVTLRTRDVEQVFCSGETAGEIIFADLRQQAPQFVVVTLADVAALNELVSRMIR